jgi:hypothetical protein
LPGPRDDFAFITPEQTHKGSGLKSMYIVGGFKNGQKMNDIYRLDSNEGKSFIWEELKV